MRDERGEDDNLNEDEGNEERGLEDFREDLRDLV